LVRDNRTGVIFIDPRTDAHRILQMAWNGGAHDVRITLYAGGPVASYLAGAAAMPTTEDGYCFAARLGARDIVVDQCAYPSAPVDSEIVLRGRVLHVLADEAPFGEFKGYYCQPTRSHVIEIDEVWCRPDAYFLGLFCGKESGLELMSLPNELLMFQHLRAQSLPVSDVRYPLKAFGEFLTIIDAPFDAAHEVLESAMRFDRRTKVIVVGPAAQSLWKSLSIFDFDAFTLPYTKRSADHGSRLGIVLRRTGDFRWTEY
jgi:4-hydroxy-3-polyprenylbenzoate decarboxylase